MPRPMTPRPLPRRGLPHRVLRGVLHGLLVRAARPLGVAALAATAAAACAACADRGAVRVVLRAASADAGDPRRLAVRAQVVGPPAGLRYRWFAVAGTCDPQVTDTPATVFRFAAAGTRDRVSVEVWRDSTRVAQGQVNVQFDERAARLEAEPAPAVQVRITEVPPFDPDGGPTTRATISGRVDGEVARDYRVVIYARADAWYIQPSPAALHPIHPDGTWATWTHTGSRYATLVVRATYEPPPTLNVLPQVGGGVLAVAAVDGARP